MMIVQRLLQLPLMLLLESTRQLNLMTRTEQLLQLEQSDRAPIKAPKQLSASGLKRPLNQQSTVSFSSVVQAPSLKPRQPLRWQTKTRSSASPQAQR